MTGTFKVLVIFFCGPHRRPGRSYLSALARRRIVETCQVYPIAVV